MGKKRLSACRYIPTGIRSQVYTPVRKNLRGVSAVNWLRRLLFASGTTSAASSTWYILAGIPVALYLSVFTCGEKAYIAKQKEETWKGQFNMRLGD
jgi:hypothetical protein